MQNEHDVKVHTLNPTENGICQAKLTEVHPSNISWHPLLAKMFNSPISAGTYHDQRIATSVLCGPNQFEPQIGLWGCYATLYKMVYGRSVGTIESESRSDCAAEIAAQARMVFNLMNVSCRTFSSGHILMH